MATEADLTAAIDNLFAEIDALTSAPRNADGSIPADHVDAIVARISAEADKIKAATATAPAPTTAPADGGSSTAAASPAAGSTSQPSASSTQPSA